MSQLTDYTGGCHCGAVRYHVSIERHVATVCNCSICQKKGFIHVIVPESRFILIQGEADLSTYTFNTGTAKHYFCRHCGIHSFYRPRSHPDAIDVNLRCLDDNPIERFELDNFDGANWEQHARIIQDRYS